MNPVAVTHAKLRLAKAEKAANAIISSRSYAESEEAWIDFLMATSAIYSKLEQGAKGFSKSEPWFGRKKKERKDDPLLRFLHFARNSAEHGIEPISKLTDGDNSPFYGQLGFNQRSPIKVQKLNKITMLPEGPEMPAVQSGPTLKAIRANDTRFNDFCDPPRTHFGNKIEHYWFVDRLAAAALPYLRQLVEEAEGLIS